MILLYGIDHEDFWDEFIPLIFEISERKHFSFTYDFFKIVIKSSKFNYKFMNLIQVKNTDNLKNNQKIHHK